MSSTFGEMVEKNDDADIDGLFAVRGEGHSPVAGVSTISGKLWLEGERIANK